MGGLTCPQKGLQLAQQKAAQMELKLGRLQLAQQKATQKAKQKAKQKATQQKMPVASGHHVARLMH